MRSRAALQLETLAPSDCRGNLGQFGRRSEHRRGTFRARAIAGTTSSNLCTPSCAARRCEPMHWRPMNPKRSRSAGYIFRATRARGPGGTRTQNAAGSRWRLGPCIHEPGCGPSVPFWQERNRCCRALFGRAETGSLAYHPVRRTLVSVRLIRSNRDLAVLHLNPCDIRGERPALERLEAWLRSRAVARKCPSLVRMVRRQPRPTACVTGSPKLERAARSGASTAGMGRASKKLSPYHCEA